MTCKSCGSKRIFSIGGKCNDCFQCRTQGKEHFGYVPKDLGIGNGDYIDIDYCGDCGTIVGKFPLPTTELERKEDDDE